MNIKKGAECMEEVINKLRNFNKIFPQEALEEAIKMKKEIASLLLVIGQ